MAQLQGSLFGQTSLLDFFNNVYCLKPKMAGGSRRTAAVYRVDVRVIDRVFRKQLIAGGQPDRAVTPADLSVDLIQAAMKSQLDAGNSRSTCNRVRRVAISLWNYAHEKGEHPDPAGKVEKYPEPKREPVCWSMGEFERIMFQASRLDGSLGWIPLATWFTALLWTVYNSGLRISAVMAIQWDWLDLAEQRLVVEPEVQKDDEGQVVILLPETVAALDQLRLRPPHLHSKPGVFDDWLYDRTQDQWPALTLQLKKLIVAAGIRPNVRSVSRRDLWHKIRRTFATYITIADGMETARDMLGHSTIEVTKRYIDKSKLKRKSQADLLPVPKPTGPRIYLSDDVG